MIWYIRDDLWDRSHAEIVSLHNVLMCQKNSHFIDTSAASELRHYQKTYLDTMSQPSGPTSLKCRMYKGLPPPTRPPPLPLKMKFYSRNFAFWVSLRYKLGLNGTLYSTYNFFIFLLRIFGVSEVGGGCNPPTLSLRLVSILLHFLSTCRYPYVDLTG